MSKKWNEFPFSATQNPRPEQHSLKWTNWFTGHRRRLCSQSQQYWCWEKKKKKNVQDATSSSGKRGEESGGLIFTRECLGKLNKLDWLLVLIILLFYYYSELSVTSLRSFLRLFFFCLTLKKTCVWSHCGERFAVQRINRTLLPLWVVVFFFPLRQWRMDSNPMFLISHYDKSCRLLHINGDCWRLEV